MMEGAEGREQCQEWIVPNSNSSQFPRSEVCCGDRMEGNPHRRMDLAGADKTLTDRSYVWEEEREEREEEGEGRALDVLSRRAVVVQTRTGRS